MKTGIARFFKSFFSKQSIVAMLIVFAFPATAASQINLSQSMWLQGTKVLIVNATEDGLIQLVANGKRIRGTVSPGNNASITFGSGLFVFYPASGYYEAAVSANICKTSSQATFVVPPPDWATDQNLLGSLALTPDYLGSNPRKSELRGRVKAIEKFLHDRLGEKEMKAELRDWLNAVEKTGLAWRDSSCSDPVVLGIRVPVYLNSYNNAGRTLAVYIRGNRTSGYRAEGPQNTAY